MSRASFLLIFASPSRVMKHNCYEIFKLKHYMLWTKRVHQSRIFQTFECSNESSTNSSCNFWNHKVRFYSHFASLFSVMTRNSRIRFLAEILCIFNKRSLSKYEFGKSLKFWTLVGFFLSKSYKVSAEKTGKSYFSLHLKAMQGLKKNWFVVLNMTWGIGWIFAQQLKCLKISFRWALFIQSIQGLSYKITDELSCMALNSDAKFESTLNLWFQKLHEALVELSLEHSMVWIFVLWWAHFLQGI